MSLLNILRQRASCRTQLPTTLTARHVISRSIACPQWAKGSTFLQPTFKRHAQSSAAATAVRTPPAYPSEINIYRAGTPITIFVGMLRVSTIVLFGVGTFLTAPNFFFSPDHSTLWVPAIILGSAIPMLTALFATGPVVHAITLQLPMVARRSKNELKRFSDAPPADTVLILHYMRLAPWLTSKEVRLGRLRRLAPSVKGGMANLEYVPEHVERHSGTIWFWLVQGYWGRYYVKRDQTNDRAQVPGVLDKMWEQIPMKGSRADPLIRSPRDASGARKVVRMSGRPGVMSGREETKARNVVPPPPPAAGKR